MAALAAAWAAPQARAGEADARPSEPFVESVRHVRPSILGIGSYESKDTPSIIYSGTGFVIDDGTIVATNAHVVEALRQRDRLAQLRVFFPDGAIQGRSATLIGEDPFHDVALLRIDGPPAPALTLDFTTDPEQGQSIGIMGYPIGLQLGLVPAAHRGVIAAVVPSVLPLPKGAKLTPELVEAIRNPYNLYQLDLVVYPGNSGSPLFDARDGRVIGIINKTLADKTREHLLTNPSGISYAVPARWIQELLIRSRASSKETTGARPSGPRP